MSPFSPPIDKDGSKPQILLDVSLRDAVPCHGACMDSHLNLLEFGLGDMRTVCLTLQQLRSFVDFEFAHLTAKDCVAEMHSADPARAPTTSEWSPVMKDNLPLSAKSPREKKWFAPFATLQEYETALKSLPESIQKIESTACQACRCHPIRRDFIDEK